MTSQSVQAIRSQDLTVGQLFNDFYVVPSFQREYVWQEKQVEQLLNDVFAEFPPPNFSGSTDEYFIGSIVVCFGPDGSDGPYEVIDGQQRITTAYIFLCAIKNYILNLPQHEPVDSLKSLILTTALNSRGVDVSRYRVSLQYEDSSGTLEKIAQDNVDLDSIDQTTVSAQNIVTAYTTIQNFINREFEQNEGEMRRFFAHFVMKVKLVRVETMSVTRALRVFETINDRGIGLNPMDLLKNLMFRQASADDYETLKSKWKELTDAIQSTNEKPNSFLRYFILSQYDDVNRDEVQSKVYEWFLDNESVCGYRKNPLNFVEKLGILSKAYANFLTGKNKDGTPNRYLSNINFLTATTRQHMSLLLAAQHLDNTCFLKLCRQIENLLFVYIVTRQKTNEFERPFIEWATIIRRVTNLDELNTFVNIYIQPIKQNLSSEFERTFTNLKEKDFQKPKLSYILAKLAQYINEKAFGNDATWLNLETYINRQVEIEHILPQTPTKSVTSSFDKPSEIKTYIPRLGNLTLLEKTINASIGNGLFADKKVAYQQSNFLLTRSLAGKIIVGSDTAINRAVQDLKEFEDWTSQAIQERQESLTELAKKVWGVSEVKPEMSENPEAPAVDLVFTSPPYSASLTNEDDSDEET